MKSENFHEIESEEDKTYTEKFIEEQDINNFEDLSDAFKGLHKGRIKLRIAILINNCNTEAETLELFNKKFILEKNPDFYKIKNSKIAKSEENKFEGYLWFIPKSQSLIIASFNTQEKFDNHFFNVFLKDNNSFSLLWINQDVTRKLIAYLSSEKSFTMTSFSSEYSPLAEIKSLLRPTLKRTLDYSGIDSHDTYSELRDRYGIIISKFEGYLKSIGYFYFNRKKSLFILRQGDLKSFIQLIYWTYEETSFYLRKIEEFGVREYKSLFTSEFSRKISNNLQINFRNDFSRSTFDEFFSMIDETEDLEVISKIDLSVGDKLFYCMKIYNRRTLGLFDVTFSNKSTSLFQSFKANYLGIFPILDIVDQCQPKNEIMVK